MTRINKIELLKILDDFKTLIDDNFPEEIDLDLDFYWSIDSNELFNPVDDPKNITLGSLEDDWNCLKKRSLKNDDNYPLSHDLLALASVFKFLKIKGEGW